MESIKGNEVKLSGLREKQKCSLETTQGMFLFTDFFLKLRKYDVIRWHSSLKAECSQPYMRHTVKYMTMSQVQTEVKA